MVDSIVDTIKQLKTDAQAIIDSNDTDDISSWNDYVSALDKMLNGDLYAILPDRPPRYK